MEENTTRNMPILNIAWKRFAQLDAEAVSRSKANLRIRRWIAALGVLATLFAILTELYAKNLPGLPTLILQALLIATPVLASVLAAFATKSFSSGDWLIKRAGAEEILKEIYFFRTILKNTPDRRAYLEKRMTEIQRQVYRGLGGELIIKPYNGPLPPPSRFGYEDSDPGFHDLTGDEYFRYRLKDQLDWHIRQVNKANAERTRLYLFIWLSGGMGSVLAALGGTFSLWVALTASLTSAFIGWQQLRDRDTVVRNYSKVIMELTIIAEHWNNLEPEERTDSEFFNMVNATEDILWSQNVEYIKAMQEALTNASLEKEAGLINRVIKESVEADARFKQSLEDSMVNYMTDTMSESQKKLTERYQSALGTLAEEASSELVQAELAAMGQAISQTAQAIAARAAGLTDKLKEIADEFNGVEISKDTPMSVVNAALARYPKSGEIKG
jgi:hypothetical protein